MTAAAQYEIEGKKKKVSELQLAIKNGEKPEGETTSMIQLLVKQQNQASDVIEKIKSVKDAAKWNEIVTTRGCTLEISRS